MSMWREQVCELNKNAAKNLVTANLKLDVARQTGQSLAFHRQNHVTDEEVEKAAGEAQR